MFKEEKGILRILEWTSQSPDLNPIELSWEEMNRKIKKKLEPENSKISKPFDFFSPIPGFFKHHQFIVLSYYFTSLQSSFFL